MIWLYKIINYLNSNLFTSSEAINIYKKNYNKILKKEIKELNKKIISTAESGHYEFIYNCNHLRKDVIDKIVKQLEKNNYSLQKEIYGYIISFKDDFNRQLKIILNEED